MKKKNKKKNKSSLRDKVRERVNQKPSGNFNYLELPKDIEKHKVKEGKNKLNIIPYEVKTKKNPYSKKGERDFERRIGVHRNVGPEDAIFLCPKVTFHKPCPICEEQEKLWKDPEVGKEESNALRPQIRQLFNVMMKDGTIKLWNFSFYCFGNLLEKELKDDEDEKYDAFADLEDGYTIKVRFEKENVGFSFLNADRIDFKKREDIDEDVLENAIDLDSLLGDGPSYDELKKAFEGNDEEKDEEDEDEDEKPKKKKIPKGKEECMACEGTGKNSKGKKCRICGGDGWIDEEEDEDEKPKKKKNKKDKKKKKKKRPVEDEDEDEDDDADSEDEDEDSDSDDTDDGDEEDTDEDNEDEDEDGEDEEDEDDD